VLIVDDQELIRTGFRMILTARGVEVVGEATDGAEAVTVARRPPRRRARSGSSGSRCGSVPGRRR